jgi:hypothetical protein
VLSTAAFWKLGKCLRLEEGLYVGVPWSTILRHMHTDRYHRMEDEFVDTFKVVVAETKEIFQEGNYVAVFGWLQWVFRRQACPSQFPQQIDAALRIGHAAYRLIERTTIVPVGSDAELATLKRAFADVATTEFRGARAHLRMRPPNSRPGTAPIVSARAFTRLNLL